MRVSRVLFWSAAVILAGGVVLVAAYDLRTSTSNETWGLLILFVGIVLLLASRWSE
jgi:hypothetical protein